MSVVLFVISLNTKISGLRGCQFDKNAMWEKQNGLSTVCDYLFVAKKRKETLAEADMLDMSCATLLHEFRWNL